MEEPGVVFMVEQLFICILLAIFDINGAGFQQYPPGLT
jgi:hypothetical protein